jgi:chromosome segregation protein
VSRLKELRLHGFKTFADPTRFVFEPGVNAVIGPNGSGKSNMADAVRWVLGEQSNRSLRTRRADDVIFAGSQQRKPQGMAEAILTLDNADGWLPIDFGEVTIGRRAYRSGESEYLINGSRARLRDIVELLGEGQLGANQLVVVGQGTVDAALSLRPEERRQLFEEAAGVKNLQVRKNEALARLGKAADNLARVRDLIAELKPQVRRLSLQAQHQQEHDAMGRRAHALVRESHRRREAKERAALGEARRSAASAEAELEAFRAEQEAGRAAVAAAEERYWQADTQARAAAEARDGTREALIRAETRFDSVAARATELDRSRDAAQAELAEVVAALGAPASADVEGLAPVIEAAAQAEAAWRAAADALAAADAATLAAEDELATARREASTEIAAEAKHGELLALADTRRERLEEELTAARTRLAALGAATAEAEHALAAAESTLAERRQEHAASLEELNLAQPRADAARRRAAELAERAGAMRGELEALREGSERSGRLGSLLTTAGWRSLLDDLDVPEEAWPAIEAVVGGELEQALLWRDGEIIERLAEARGAARLLTTGRPDVGDDERKRGMAAVGADQTLAEWLGPAEVPQVFWRVAMAPDIDHLLRGWRELPTGWSAATRHGDLADARGIVAVRGRAEPPRAEAARRHQRRRELADALEQAEAEGAEATRLAARELAAVGATGRRAEEARIALAEAQRAEAAARAGHDGSAGEAARLSDHIDELGERLRDTEAERAALARERPEPVDVSGAARIAQLTERAEAARRERDAAARRRDEARDAWLAARGAAEREEQQVAGGRQQRAVLEARRAQLEAQLPELEASIAGLAEQRAAAEAALDVARTADAEASTQRATAESTRDELRSELRSLEQRGGAAAGQLAALEQTAQAAAIDASRHEEALAALDRERALALESLPELGQDAEVTGATSEVSGLDDATLDQELRRVRRTLAQIGSVNPFAVEEHGELASRLTELTDQEADLSRAADATGELIGRLDADISGQFQTAFEAIAERFDEFCRLLFAGGSASLQLGDAEDGEAPGGIEIVVRPPGKRLQRLAMLSGGERALTGVALLFAMLSVNPVPFCILDEVDAALDEANIGRFASALRRLAEDTDFVVITHNRATIEVADTIYGVTMTDAAVSRIVSLRLADLPADATVEVPA